MGAACAVPKAAQPGATQGSAYSIKAQKQNTPAPTLELQELRAKMDGLLAPLQQTAHAEATHKVTKLPAALKDFTPLSAEPDIKAASARLPALELALVKAPSSKATHSELRAAVAMVEKVMAAKIKERAASLQDEKNLYHAGISCHTSGQSPIVGNRYHLTGKDFDLCEAEFLKLPDAEMAKYEKITPPCSRMLQECEAAIADGNRDFEVIYNGVHKVIESGDADGLARFRTAVSELAGVATGEVAQRDEAADPATLLYDAALAKPAFDQVASCLASSTGAKLELQLLGDTDAHGRELTGLKKMARIIEKAQLRPGERRGKTERVCDCVRAMLVAKDMETVAATAEALVALHRAGAIKVVRIKDRFGSPSAGGWRDLMVNLVVLDGAAGERVRHVCELQIAHEMMLTARKGLPGHEIYAIVRNALEIIESCGLEHQLRIEEVRKRRAGGATDAAVVALYADAWLLGDEEWATRCGNAAQLAARVQADEVGRVKVLNLVAMPMKELPTSVGRLQALDKLLLGRCSSLTSLPAELRRCEGLKLLHLQGCENLISLPDLSGLEKLTVEGVPEAMLPWKKGGFKAFALPTEAEMAALLYEDGWLLDDKEWLQIVGNANQLAAKVTANDEGRVVKVTIRCNKMKELPASVGKLPALEELDLMGCDQLTSLPAELGQCAGLKKLVVGGCSSLTSLPAELGQCVGLESLILYKCDRLTSMPDLSGIEKLMHPESRSLGIHGLPEAVKYWEKMGCRAYTKGMERTAGDFF